MCSCDFVNIYHVTNFLLKPKIARNENQNKKNIKSGNARSLKKIRNFSCRLLCATTKPPTKVVTIAQTNQNTKKNKPEFSEHSEMYSLFFAFVCHIFINSHTFQQKKERKKHATEGVQIYFR